MQMRQKPVNQKGMVKSEVMNDQMELLVVSGTNNTSYINLINKGINVRKLADLSDLPPLSSEDGLLVVGDLMILKFPGIPDPLTLRITALDSAGPLPISFGGEANIEPRC